MGVGLEVKGRRVCRLRGARVDEETCPIRQVHLADPTVLSEEVIESKEACRVAAAHEREGHEGGEGGVVLFDVGDIEGGR